ncbi:MAG: hypothetical protein HRS50_01520 [Mycoplasmataceae bacterium]|nr:hypothetical protein [Mycoplasmataceae bacterium]
MIKGNFNEYKVNGEKVSNEVAIDYARKHPETYQVYELDGEWVIRTAKGGYCLDACSSKQK